MSAARSKVVVLRAAGLGDLCTAVPALRAVRDAHPQHELVLATTAWLAPLASTVDAVDRVVTTPGLGRLPSVVDGADLAVNLHGSGPQSHRVLLAAGPRRLLAHRHADVPEAADGPRWPTHVHDVLRWSRLLGAYGIACDPSRLRLPAPEEGAAASGCTLVHPGAGHAARRWPLRRWIDLVRRLADDGHEVVVTGSTRERRTNAVLCTHAGLPDQVNLAGRTDVRALAAIVAASALVVSADTGVAHLATAFGTPSVTLFGPMPPAEWGASIDRERHVELWHGVRGDPRADRPDEGLLRISVDEVHEAVHRLDSWPRDAAGVRETAELASG